MDTLGRMRAYVEIVEAGGYSAAAQKIGRSKALLSKYVRELEDELGTLLINRTTRQFSLTEAGNLYYRSAQEILERIVEAEDSVRESGRGLKGRLRVAAPRSLSGLGFGLPIAEFTKANPEIVLELVLDDRIVDLVDERFDVAIRIGKLQDSSLIARRLTDFKMVICASPKFLEKTCIPSHPKELAGLPAIVDTNWRGRNSWLFKPENGQEFSITVDTVMEVNDPMVCRRVALLGLGITMVPEFSVADDIENGTLVSLVDDFLPRDAGFYAVYAQRRHVPAKVRAFVDFMADWFYKHPKVRANM